MDITLKPCNYSTIVEAQNHCLNNKGSATITTKNGRIKMRYWWDNTLKAIQFISY